MANEYVIAQSLLVRESGSLGNMRGMLTYLHVLSIRLCILPPTHEQGESYLGMH